MESQPTTQLMLSQDFADVVLQVAENRYTGARSAVSERAEELVKDMLAGMTMRGVCRKFSCDYRTVHAVMDRLAANGRIPTLEQQLSRDVSAVAAMSWENLAEKHARGLPISVPESVVAGMSLDKKQLLSGQPTSITEERRVDVNELVGRLERLKAGSIDCESIGISSQPIDNQGVNGILSERVAVAVAGEAAEAAAPGGRRTAAGDQVDRDKKRGGGGAESSEGVEITMGSSDTKFEPKDL